MIREDPKAAREAFHAQAKANDPNPGCKHCGKRHRTITEDQCVDRSMSEKTLQARIVGRAKTRGWSKIAHAGRAWVGGEGDDGHWVTPMAKGWPDLFLLNEKRRAVLVIECKKEQEEPDEDQIAWLQALNRCGIPAVVCRPSDLREGRVNAILEGR